MAIHAQIRKEINEYQPKLFFGLSGRQIVFSLAGVAVGVASYFVFSQIVGKELAGYVVIALVAPLFALGFIKIDGDPFERYLIKLIRYTLYPKARIYTSIISHNPVTDPVNKEQKNAKKAKYSRETFITEYNIVTRQRENTAAYQRIKQSGTKHI